MFLLFHTRGFSELLILQSPLISLLVNFLLWSIFLSFIQSVIVLRYIFWNWKHNFNCAEWSVYAPIDQLLISFILLCNPKNWPWWTASISLSYSLVSRYAQTVGGTNIRLDSKRKEKWRKQFFSLTFFTSITWFGSGYIPLPHPSAAASVLSTFW